MNLELLPSIRNTNIVSQQSGQELIIYDLETNKAYLLNETSTKIYQACDGQTSFDELMKKHNFSEDLIHFALDELYMLNLISSNYKTKFDTLPRRDIIKKIGLSTAAALPLVVAVVAPKAVHAQSCVNPGGAGTGTAVTTTITNTSPNTTDNQNLAATFLRVQCCSNAYRNFISSGCSSGVGGTCNAQAICL